jgi:tetratricopeptide (TPR) repeat protein
LSALGLHAQALADYAQAVALDPTSYLAYLGYGNGLYILDRYEEALAAYEHAIALKPDDCQAYANHGNALKKLNRHDDALISYERGLALKPDEVELLCNHGGVLAALRRYDEALASCNRAIELRPGYIPAHEIRAEILTALERHAEALASFCHVIQLDSARPDAYCNYGVALCNLGRLEPAMAAFEQALALDPEHAATQFGKAWALLQLGDYAKGFALYEWRLRGGARHKFREFTQARWRGETVTGQTLLLHAEQGLGDNTQFLRYLPLVKEKAARVVLELPKTLWPLLGALADGLTVVEPGSALPRFDLHCPFMSLPFALGTTLATVPAQIPYLTLPAERLPRWRARLPSSARPRVGLVWSSSTPHPHARKRNIELERFASLLQVEGFSFVSLQVEYHACDLNALARLPIERIDHLLADFGDTAAAIEQCDLVISIDTSVAHLAGALGKPLWLLLPLVADWRWLQERADSPWYPTARLFRQQQDGDWESVITRIAKELRALKASLT